MKKVLFIAIAIFTMSAVMVSCADEVANEKKKVENKVEEVVEDVKKVVETTETEQLFTCSKCKDGKTFKKGEKCCDAEMIEIKCCSDDKKKCDADKKG